MLNFFSKTQKPSQFSDGAKQEVIRQARWSFNTALILMGASATITLYGVVKGNIDEAAMERFLTFLLIWVVENWPQLKTKNYKKFWMTRKTKDSIRGRFPFSFSVETQNAASLQDFRLSREQTEKKVLGVIAYT